MCVREREREVRKGRKGHSLLLAVDLVGVDDVLFGIYLVGAVLALEDQLAVVRLLVGVQDVRTAEEGASRESVPSHHERERGITRQTDREREREKR